MQQAKCILSFSLAVLLHMPKATTERVKWYMLSYNHYLGKYWFRIEFKEVGHKAITLNIAQEW